MIKFTYCYLYGRGEASKLLLQHANVQFEDERITFEQWGALKGKAMGGALPNLKTEEGTIINESVASLRYLGARFGYYSNDPIQMWTIDSTIEAVQD